MNKFTQTLFLFLSLVTSSAFATVIKYEATDLIDTTPGDNLWHYRYEVSGLPADGLGFDIIFSDSDGFLFGDLESSPVAPNADWDVLAIQADPNISDAGRLDVLSLVNSVILPETFNIDFIWRGVGVPASQRFEIFDSNFAILETGVTIPFNSAISVPEPSPLWLWLCALLIFWMARSVKTKLANFDLPV